jgi:hypothetical protein
VPTSSDIGLLIAEALAAEYVTYYQELFNHTYLRSAGSFIKSSPEKSG